jgi:Tol biopolymer transport system component
MKMIDASGDAVAQKTCWDHWHDGTATLGDVKNLGLGLQNVVDRDPWVTRDERSLYFASNRLGSNNADIFVATRDTTSDPFGTPARPTDFTNINTSGFNESKCSMTSDELLVVFASDKMRASPGDFDLYQATRATVGDAFTVVAVSPMFDSIDDEQGQFDPDISPDGLELYYAPFNSTDPFQSIQRSMRATTGDTWAHPVPVSELTSGVGDADPSRSSDNLVIVFSSLRPGAGLIDVWYAVRAHATDPWGPPAQIPGIDTADNEADPILSADGCHLYFASDRGNQRGDYDIFVATMTP